MHSRFYQTLERKTPPAIKLREIKLTNTQKALKFGKAQVLTWEHELFFHAEYLTPHKLQVLQWQQFIKNIPFNNGRALPKLIF